MDAEIRKEEYVMLVAVNVIIESLGFLPCLIETSLLIFPALIVTFPVLSDDVVFSSIVATTEISPAEPLAGSIEIQLSFEDAVQDTLVVNAMWIVFLLYVISLESVPPFNSNIASCGVLPSSLGLEQESRTINNPEIKNNNPCFIVIVLQNKADRFQTQQWGKKSRNLSIKREPLDGASSNKHPAYMFGATNGVETFQNGLSICSKRMSRLSLKDELPFALGISRPSSSTKIGKSSEINEYTLI